MEKPAEPFECVILIPILTIVGQGAPSFGNSLRRPGGKKHHQTIRFRVREWTHQDGVDYRKDRRVRSDAQRQRYDNDDRKDRILDRGPKAVSEILPKRLHVKPPLVKPLSHYIRLLVP